MIEWLNAVFSNNGEPSSSRIINFIGCIAATVWISYDVINHPLNVEAFGLYLAYCGGVYVGGKYFDAKGQNVVS